MGWLSDFRADIGRYQRYNGGSAARECVTQQGLWALLQYRMARAAYTSDLSPAVKRPLLVGFYAWRKGVEVVTGITLPHTSSIGRGTYLNHYGPILVNKESVIGEGCDISHCVTIGVAGHGEKAGSPVIGDHVYIGPNAVVVGRITVGDDAGIGANCVVSQDVPAGAVVRPAPVVVGERARATGASAAQAQGD
jgi:serine O-acetyltransferase